MRQTDQLKRFFIFSDFDQDELATAAKLFHRRAYKKGEIIFHEGQPGSAFYLIESGRIKIYKLAEDGRELIFSIFGNAEIFGDVPVFDGGRYPASAAAIVDTETLYITRADFEALINDFPQIGLKIIRVLGKRLRRAHRLVMEMAVKSVPQRLAGLLLRLAEEYGRPEDGAVLIELPLSRQEIADLIGVSRETATRELSKFGRSGVVELEGKKIRLVDKAKLEFWAKM